ncbi:hypothetical protein ACFQ1B_30700 [Streptomyces mexicanus]
MTPAAPSRHSHSTHSTGVRAACPGVWWRTAGGFFSRVLRAAVSGSWCGGHQFLGGHRRNHPAAATARHIPAPLAPSTRGSPAPGPASRSTGTAPWARPPTTRAVGPPRRSGYQVPGTLQQVACTSPAPAPPSAARATRAAPGSGTTATAAHTSSTPAAPLTTARRAESRPLSRARPAGKATAACADSHRHAARNSSPPPPGVSRSAACAAIHAYAAPLTPVMPTQGRTTIQILARPIRSTSLSPTR